MAQEFPSVCVRTSRGVTRHRERLPGEMELAAKTSVRTSVLGGVTASHWEPVTPGTRIAAGSDFMRGHGTYVVSSAENEVRAECSWSLQMFVL